MLSRGNRRRKQGLEYVAEKISDGIEVGHRFFVDVVETGHLRRKL